MTQDKTAEVAETIDIQAVLRRLEVNNGKLPREALTQAIENRELMIPELLHILEYAHHNIEEIAERADYFAHIYDMFLLAQFREPRAYPLIVQLVSRPGKIIMDIAGGVVTERLCRILASVSCGDTSLMMELAENESANEYVRVAAVRGLLTLVACGERPREEIIAYYQSLFREKIARDDFSFIWNGLVASSNELYPEELYDDIIQAYDEGRIETFFIGLEDVEETLKRGKEYVLDDLRHNKRYKLITDTISELEGWACFKPSQSRYVVKPKEKIGRNQPCPCGSGKKYKRCCGANR